MDLENEYVRIIFEEGKFYINGTRMERYDSWVKQINLIAEKEICDKK